MDEPSYVKAETCNTWLRLRHCRGVPDSALLGLLRQLGSASAIFAASTPTLQRILSNTEISRHRINSCDEQRVENDMGWAMASPRHHIVPWLDERYPPLLRELTDPPLLLYVNGNPKLLSSTQLAIVGSRNPTPTGRELAFHFSRRLSALGFTITSGLAIGIDAAAHEGTLSVAGPTIAVLANGPDIIYPSRNRQLAQGIATNGALVFEHPVGTRPRRSAFPLRNRIISGLCVGTLVVEAAARSGSLITARLAAEQGREVYAVPGSVLSPMSRGCHALIRDGAGLVETEADILAELGSFNRPRAVAPGPPADNKSALLVETMGYDPVTIDTLVRRSGLTADTVSSMILCLELQGVVKPIQGGHYIRIG